MGRLPLLLVAVLPLLLHTPAGAAGASPTPQPCALATQRAALAEDALREHFWNGTTGLWDENLWWQSACSLEVLGRHALTAGNATLRASAASDIATLYNHTANMSKGGPTITGYYDDEEWWAMGWLRAWELTGNASYVERTDTILNHMTDASWNESSCGGGFMWQGYLYGSKSYGNPYKGAITNELFLLLSAKMAVLGPPGNRSHYAEWATKAWSWFKSSGLIGEKGMVNDGLDSFTGHLEICRNNNQTAFTYNQGVIVGALGYLYELTGRDDLLQTAANIANASMTHLVHTSDPGAKNEICIIIDERCISNDGFCI